MKGRLNVITLLILFAFGVHSVSVLTEGFYDFKSSFKSGMETAVEGKKVNKHYLTLLPDDGRKTCDSVYNEKTGIWMSARTVQTIVYMPKEDGRKMDWEDLWVFPMFFIVIPAFFMIVASFFQLVSAVNESVIFDWANVRRLRRIGIGFIVLFAVLTAFEFHHHLIAVDLIKVSGYKIIAGDVFDATTLIFGLITLLIAEIFSAGLRLKEEQDLTV
ncbi:hypothetical protein Barb7_01643 [Bacteroidales bacterium Barb7]|nr:hypothetical protein Barb7_01643 [Bacteroidales bacterium Barb7]